MIYLQHISKFSKDKSNQFSFDSVKTINGQFMIENRIRHLHVLVPKDLSGDRYNESSYEKQLSGAEAKKILIKLGDSSKEKDIYLYTSQKNALQSHRKVLYSEFKRLGYGVVLN